MSKRFLSRVRQLVKGDRRWLAMPVLFGLVGTAVLIVSQAATFEAAFEAESGTGANTIKISDSTASGALNIQGYGSNQQQKLADILAYDKSNNPIPVKLYQ